MVKSCSQSRNDASPAPAQPAVFDADRLSQSTMGDTALGAEIMNLFLVQLGQAEDQVLTAATAQDWKFLTHTLKGSAATVGAMELAALARLLEEGGLPASLEERQAARQALTDAATAFRGQTGM